MQQRHHDGDYAQHQVDPDQLADAVDAGGGGGAVATVLGIAIWGEWPDVWSLVGVAVLIATGLYIWHREVTLGLRR